MKFTEEQINEIVDKMTQAFREKFDENFRKNAGKLERILSYLPEAQKDE